MRLSFGILAVGLAWSGGAFPIASARAGVATITCPQFEPDSFDIDGLLDDWSQVKRVAPAGALADVRCAYDESTLYIAVRVDDDKIVRSGGSLEQNDGFAIDLWATTGEEPAHAVILPNNHVARAKLQAPGKWQKAVSLQENGYSAELAIPFAAVRGLVRTTPAVQFAFTLGQCASAQACRGGNTPAFTGKFHLAHSVPAYRAFLSATKVSPKALKTDILANVDDNPGSERVVAAGGFLGVLSNDFAFVRLAANQSEVLSVELKRPAGARRSVIVSHAREQAQNGSRDVLTFWRVDMTGQLSPIAKFTVRLELGGSEIVNHWEVTEGSSKKNAGLLLTLSAESAGFTPEQFAGIAMPGDTPAMLVPWTKPGSVTYRLEENQLVQLP